MTTLHWHNEKFELLAERALFWERASTVFVADIHFGKTECFRQFGIGLPHGTTGENLNRLEKCLATTGADRLVVLGDFFHGKASHAPHVLQALKEWRARLHGVEMCLVLGNHDKHAGQPPDFLEIKILDCGHSESGIAFCHEPNNTYEKSFAGHVHPGVVLGDSVGSVRLPCYVVREEQIWMPAFGEFTGLYTEFEQFESDRIFVCAPGLVRELPRASHIAKRQTGRFSKFT